MSARTMAMKSIDDACNDACTLARAPRGGVRRQRGCGRPERLRYLKKSGYVQPGRGPRLPARGTLQDSAAHFTTQVLG
jgi:hypothetical protein